MNINDVKKNKNNPRVIKDDKFLKLKKSIEEFPKMMELRPIVVDSNNMVLGGNMRLAALKDLGYKEIPDNWVKKADELTEVEKQRFIVVDNVGFGEWEYDALLEGWNKDDLENWGVDIPEFKFQKENDEHEDDVPEAKSPFLKKGDLIEMNNHRLFCGDSCDASDVVILMKDQKADLIFTDPPYDLEDNYSTIIINQAKNDSHVFIMNSDKLLIQNIKNNEECFRKMFYVDFRQARLVSNNQPMTRVDPIAEFCKGKTKFNNLRDGFSTLIECSKIHNNDAAQNHGFNQAKKVELPETFILHYSKPNELVCDFFGGSGSTLIACEKNNRICYVNEFEPSHCDIILKRWIMYMNEHSKLYEIKINGEKINDETICELLKE